MGMKIQRDEFKYRDIELQYFFVILQLEWISSDFIRPFQFSFLLSDSFCLALFFVFVRIYRMFAFLAHKLRFIQIFGNISFRRYFSA